VAVLRWSKILTLFIKQRSSPRGEEQGQMWIALSYSLAVLLVGVGLSGLLCVPCCWRYAWPRGQPLPLRANSWSAYFVALGAIAVLWTVPTLLWFANSPLSMCSAQWTRSNPPVREAVAMSEWEGFWCTRLCGESALVHPTRIAEVQAALRAATSLRVVGSGHSVTDLQCPDVGGVVMSIDGLCEYGSISTLADGRDVATFSAGCTISGAQQWLMAGGYQLIGYGAIMSQTIAGALATSLHGEFTNSSFGDHLVALKAVTADGSVRSVGNGDDELFAWVGSAGELGVIVEVTMRIWPTMRVVCETHRSTQADAEAALLDQSLTMLVIDTLLGPDVGDRSFAIRSCREVQSPLTGQPIEMHSVPTGELGQVYETYGLSALRLFSTLPLVPGLAVGGFLLAAEHGPREENSLDASFYSAKGVYNVYPHSELAVPVERCMQLLDRMRVEADRVGLAYVLAIKALAASPAWRTWAPHRSCAINLDFYDFGHGDSVTRDLQFRAFTEKVAVDELGGGMHLGKLWVRPNREELLRNAPRADDFEALRQTLDPTGKLQNQHTRSVHGNGTCDDAPIPTALDGRSAAWRASIWIGVTVSVAVSIAACTSLAYAARRRQSSPLVTRRPVVPGSDGLPLLGMAVPSSARGGGHKK
jgi:xylitol oxidase